MTTSPAKQSHRYADGTVGICHLCRHRVPVAWCNVCQHFFCDACKLDYWNRGFSAVMELVSAVTGRLSHLDRPCCGPEAQPEEGAGL